MCCYAAVRDELFMVDPLDAYYSFLPESGELFLGTVGNINFMGRFLTFACLFPCGSFW